MGDLTQILNVVEGGDGQAVEQLFPIVYGELRRLAQAKMAAERSRQTLDATGLVHQAYIRLVGSDNAESFKSEVAVAALGRPRERH